MLFTRNFFHFGRSEKFYQIYLDPGDHSAATEGSDQSAQKVETNAGQPTSSVTAKGEL